MSVFIIAEIGINHNGDIEIAKQSIDAAKASGADCIKFQTFDAKEFVSDPKQTYTYISQGKEVTESMLKMFERYQFSKDEWKEIINYCKEKEVVFCSTAQNPKDLDFLMSMTELPFIKVGSDDLTNLDLMYYYGSKNIPMVISAGMSYAYEIEDAVREIRRSGNKDITVLHCVSSYPTPAHSVNLKKIPIIRDAFGVKVGYSDHTVGNTAAVGAVVLGSEVIEKHFTLDNNFPGPDHRFSINPEDFKSYVDSIRDIEKNLGESYLRPTETEIGMRDIARRKVAVRCELEKGSVISKEDLIYLRGEGEGFSPKEGRFLIGRVLNKTLEKSQVITTKDII